jgi:hypothetical protein
VVTGDVQKVETQIATYQSLVDSQIGGHGPITPPVP